MSGADGEEELPVREDELAGGIARLGLGGGRMELAGGIVRFGLG